MKKKDKTEQGCSKRKELTPEERRKCVEATREWVKKNKERRRVYMREYMKGRAEKLKKLETKVKTLEEQLNEIGEKGG